MRNINWPYLVAFGQKIEKRLNLTVFENFMKWGAPITDFSDYIIWLLRPNYNHFCSFYAWVSKQIHFHPQHAVHMSPENLQKGRRGPDKKIELDADSYGFCIDKK